MSTPEPRFLGLPTVKNLTSLSEPTIRRAVERGEFPKPVKISPNRIAWLESVIVEWIEARPVVT